MSAGTDRFAQARANEHQLNERQRAVLELLVKGRTNGEIAAELGMTLDGAKWNVSEILGKLGLESREQAAEYWRGRGRRKVRLPAMRGLAGATALKWAGGVAAVAVVGLVVAGLYRRTEDSPELPPFYLEATIRVVDRSQSVGLSDGIVRPTETLNQLKWWNEGTDLSRWEIVSSGGLRDATLVVADGQTEWTYTANTASYSQRPLSRLPQGLRVRAPALSTVVGPVPFAEPGKFGEAVEDWGGPGATWRRTGSADVLGRRTTIYEARPASKSSSEPGTTEGDGYSRYWIDEERHFIMRYELVTEAAEAYAEVTRLDWRTDIPAQTFKFVAPPGAVEVPDGQLSDSRERSSGPRGTSVAVPLAAGFFRSTSTDWLPFEWERVLSGSTVTQLDARFAKDGSGPEIHLQQWASGVGLPPSLQDGEQLLLANGPAWVQHFDDDIRITTSRGPIAIVVTGYSVPRSELLAFAESLEVAP